MLKGKYSFYNYGIKGVKENDICNNNCTKEDREKTTNPELLILEYGYGKRFVFRKDDAYKLLEKILGKSFLKELKIDELTFYKNVIKFGYEEALNTLIKGRAIVIVTNLSNHLEYWNGVQNDIVGLTGIDINGEYIAQDEKDLFPDIVTYKDIYEYNKVDKETERE